jgi:hypothetical protein
MESKLTRRALLKAGLIVPPVAMAGCASLPGSQSPAVKADDPVARAVAYYPNSADVPADNPLATNHDPAQTCSNCLHRRESVGNDKLLCPTFPGRVVDATGWCMLWADS